MTIKKLITAITGMNLVFVLMSFSQIKYYTGKCIDSFDFVFRSDTTGWSILDFSATIYFPNDSTRIQLDSLIKELKEKNSKIKIYVLQSFSGEEWLRMAFAKVVSVKQMFIEKGIEEKNIKKASEKYIRFGLMDGPFWDTVARVYILKCRKFRFGIRK